MFVGLLRVRGTRVALIFDGCADTGSRATSAPATRQATAPAASTTAGVATTRIPAAASGPSVRPIPSIVPDSPFAAVSSSGVRDTLGSRAPWVGRVIVSDVAPAAASTYTRIGGAPTAIASAVNPKATAWTR